MNVNPESAVQPTPEAPTMPMESSTSTPSTQPEYVLRRATELLNGQAIQIDVAAFTQRILNSIEGQSIQELQALAQRYVEATHVTPDTQTDTNALQELALTAAILEGRAHELATPTVEPTAESAALAAPEPLEQLQPIVDDADIAAVEADEQPAQSEDATPEQTTEEIEKLQQLRSETIQNTFQLAPEATAQEVFDTAASMISGENRSQIETAIAELKSIEARLNNNDAVTVFSQPLKATTTTPTETAPAQPEPVEEPKVAVVEEKDEASQTTTEPETEIKETVEQPQQQATTETDPVSNEGNIKIDHAISAITDDISALEKTLKRYEERERDLHEQVGTIERHLPHFALSKDRLRMVKALNAIQIAVAHTRESLESLRANMVAVQNANEEFDVMFDEITEAEESNT